MKRYIKSQYIPDMTERYPEGMGTREYDAYLDDIDVYVVTLGERLELYMEDEANGDFCNHVIIIQGGRLIYESLSLKQAYDDMDEEGMFLSVIDSSRWYDTEVTITLRR